MLNSSVDLYKLATEYLITKRNGIASDDIADQIKASRIKASGIKFSGADRFADLFTDIFSSTDHQDKSLSWIREYEGRLRYLMENNGETKEIEGTRNIIHQLRLQKIERAMYDAFGFNNDDDERNSGSVFEALNRFNDIKVDKNRINAGGLSNLLLAQLI